MTKRHYEYSMYQEQRGLIGESSFAICYTSHPGGIAIRVMSVVGYRLAKRVMDYLNDNDVEPHQ